MFPIFIYFILNRLKHEYNSEKKQAYMENIQIHKLRVTSHQTHQILIMLTSTSHHPKNRAV